MEVSTEADPVIPITVLAVPQLTRKLPMDILGKLKRAPVTHRKGHGWMVKRPNLKSSKQSS